MRLLCAFTVLLWLAVPALAVNPNEMLSDPALEARARAISEGLRCLVCQNQSIDDSDADLAHELRVIVRERLTAGDTDQQVIDYIVARYGEFVLLRPVVAPHTIVLWLAAPLVLIVGGIAIVLALRRRKPGTTRTLSPEEKAVLEDLQRGG
ncbi:MAG TPA: cytochrome c-type biogenesis protein [Devosia sp.]|nr:cytochrome c-type biogenesis protein [Devosia sp.]